MAFGPACPGSHGTVRRTVAATGHRRSPGAKPRRLV